MAMGDLVSIDTRRHHCSVCRQPMLDVQAGRHVDSRLDPPMPGGTWFCDLKLELMRIQEVVAELRINASRADLHGESRPATPALPVT